MAQEDSSFVLFAARGKQYSMSSSEIVRISYLSEDEVSPLPVEMTRVRGLINQDGRPVLLTDPFGCHGTGLCIIARARSGEFAFLIDQTLRAQAAQDVSAEPVTEEALIAKIN